MRDVDYGHSFSASAGRSAMATALDGTRELRVRIGVPPLPEAGAEWSGLTCQLHAVGRSMGYKGLIAGMAEELAELAGPPLPNSFEEKFAALIVTRTPSEAYIAAGFLPTGDYRTRAEELARHPDVRERCSRIEGALNRLQFKYSDYFFAIAGNNKTPSAG